SFGVFNRPVERGEIDLFARGFDVHPAALAAQVAGVDDREVEEGRKIFAAAQAALEALDGQHPLHAEIPHELTEQPRIGRAEDAEGEGWEHAETTITQKPERCERHERFSRARASR